METSNDFENTINLGFAGKSPRGAPKEAIGLALKLANHEDQDPGNQSETNTLTVQDPGLDGLADISEVVDGMMMDRDVSADAENFGR